MQTQTGTHTHVPVLQEFPSLLYNNHFAVNLCNWEPAAQGDSVCGERQPKETASACVILVGGCCGGALSLFNGKRSFCLRFKTKLNIHTKNRCCMHYA